MPDVTGHSDRQDIPQEKHLSVGYDEVSRERTSLGCIVSDLLQAWRCAWFLPCAGLCSATTSR